MCSTRFRNVVFSAALLVCAATASTGWSQVAISGPPHDGLDLLVVHGTVGLGGGGLGPPAGIPVANWWVSIIAFPNLPGPTGMDFIFALSHFAGPHGEPPNPIEVIPLGGFPLPPLFMGREFVILDPHGAHVDLFEIVILPGPFGGYNFHVLGVHNPAPGVLGAFTEPRRNREVIDLRDSSPDRGGDQFEPRPRGNNRRPRSYQKGGSARELTGLSGCPRWIGALKAGRWTVRRSTVDLAEASEERCVHRMENTLDIGRGRRNWCPVA